MSKRDSVSKVLARSYKNKTLWPVLPIEIRVSSVKWKAAAMTNFDLRIAMTRIELLLYQIYFLLAD